MVLSFHVAAEPSAASWGALRTRALSRRSHPARSAPEGGELAWSRRRKKRAGLTGGGPGSPRSRQMKPGGLSASKRKEVRLETRGEAAPRKNEGCKEPASRRGRNAPTRLRRGRRRAKRRARRRAIGPGPSAIDGGSHNAERSAARTRDRSLTAPPTVSGILSGESPDPRSACRPEARGRSRPRLCKNAVVGKWLRTPFRCAGFSWQGLA